MDRILRLTPLQHAALVGILVEYLRVPNCTQEWINVPTDETVTLDELLTLVTLAPVEKPK
jgi:hypothetical protein